MKYYKLMKDSKIFGVCNSNDFKYYNPNSNLILSSDEIHGQLIRYKQQLYRDYWMTDLPANFNRAYELVKVAEITDNEFNVLFEMLSKIDYIVESKEESGTPVITVVPSTFQEEPTVEAVRKLKLQELSNICNQTIENGFDTTLSDNVSHHFSLTTQDQLNLISIGQMAASLGGVDAIVFTATIGERSEEIRRVTTQKLAYLGFALDKEKNAADLKEHSVNVAAEGSKPIWVIKTDESGEMIRKGMEILDKLASQ